MMNLVCHGHASNDYLVVEDECQAARQILSPLSQLRATSSDHPSYCVTPHTASPSSIRSRSRDEIGLSIRMRGLQADGYWVD